MRKPVAAALPPQRILLVDDNVGGLRARKCVLEEHGFAVTTCPCPHEALGEFERGDFHLLVTDYCMPLMNGGDLIRRIREIRPQVPIILLSGMVEPLGLTEKSTGADAVLPKTANEIAHLLQTINRLLRNRAPRKPVGSAKRPSATRSAR
jgi:CheY-like chemotaxis protein